MRWLISEDGASSASCSANDCMENVEICISCLICGAAVPLYDRRIEVKVCDDCKRAVLAMRKMLELQLEETEQGG